MFINKSLLGSMQHRVLSELRSLGAIHYGLQVQICGLQPQALIPFHQHCTSALEVLSLYPQKLEVVSRYFRNWFNMMVSTFMK